MVNILNDVFYHGRTPVRKNAFVANMTDAYDTEGYKSMSGDIARNDYFIHSIGEIRNANRSSTGVRRLSTTNDSITKFIEIGPGADAKLTHYILSSREDVFPNVRFKSTVLAIEVNNNSAIAAERHLSQYNTRAFTREIPVRVKVEVGDAVEVLKKHTLVEPFKPPFQCMVAEVIGYVASCEGQCRLVRAVTNVNRMTPEFFVPLNFSTYLSPYTGTLPDDWKKAIVASKKGVVRIRHLSAKRHLHSKDISQDKLILEEWNSLTLNHKGEEVNFESSVNAWSGKMSGYCLFVGFIQLDQGPDSPWCSSKPSERKKRRATNWDNLLILLPRTFADNNVTLKSSINPFLDNPTYVLNFSAKDVTHKISFTTKDLFNEKVIERLPRIIPRSTGGKKSTGKSG